jgi:poly(beta-D-mannuronate) lyase
VVNDNLFTECNGEVEIISNKSCENVYRHNAFVDCEGTLTLRHGHRNVVEGNFFFGHGKPKTGGVRIINLDQRVVNNYFADLAGEGPFAAVCMMNGIPNSPLAGYDQVKRALVAFNTIVNCRQSMMVGYQSSTRSEATLAPVDCTFAHNVVVGRSAPLVRVQTAPERTVWRGNFFNVEPGVQDEVNAQPRDPRLELARDGLWRPGAQSPVIGAATGNFPEVTGDIDGQSRPAAAKDAGCDQRSEEAVRFRALTDRDVGPEWRRAAVAR